jgi:hypothetical protein
MLRDASAIRSDGRPPAMLKRPVLDVYVGYGNLETIRRCRFLPMATNRCISQDVVAQRVAQNLSRLSERGSYHDFGQISLVAVRSPSTEQYVQEASSASAAGSGRCARFYVLDGQHRLQTMVELARERPDVPIWFELSVQVVTDKEAANEALLHMQHTYRADPKCFFTKDDEADVAARTLDLAKLQWPAAFSAADASSFSRPTRPVVRPRLDDGLFFDVLRDTRLLALVCSSGTLKDGVAATPTTRPLALFDAIDSVNEALRKDAERKHARGKLADRTFTDCRGKFNGCFLGLYRRDKAGVELLEMLKTQSPPLVPADAQCPLDE